MTLDLTDKTLLVTGGTRGIGRAVVEAAAAAGARVAFTYRASADAADQLAADLGGADRALALQADAASREDAEASVQAVTDAWGSIDGLVVNAGITRDGLMIRMDAEAWQDVIDTNLTGAFHLIKAAYRPMMRQRAGSIVTVSSVVGVTGNAGQANYAASKAGLIGLTKSVARELGVRGVRANAVAPGYIDTDMTAGLGDKAVEAMQGQIPLGPDGPPGGDRWPPSCSCSPTPPPTSPATCSTWTAGWRCSAPAGGRTRRAVEPSPRCTPPAKPGASSEPRPVPARGLAALRRGGQAAWSALPRLVRTVRDYACHAPVCARR